MGQIFVAMKWPYNMKGNVDNNKNSLSNVSS